jgi:uncharacterized protein (TIGR00369 family)
MVSIDLSARRQSQRTNRFYPCRRRRALVDRITNAPFLGRQRAGTIASMRASNPDYADKVRRLFVGAPILEELGIEAGDIGEGFCESRLVLAKKHLQQDGFVHAGVVATMADHTAGGAAGTLVDADRTVLTIEFKINLLRPARGESMRCRATVLRPGRTISVVESEVFTRSGDRETLVAKAMVTLAVVDANVGSLSVV